ncbi:MAG TPA: hypothetical protein VHJ20_09585 [Polyangia bacterium]|nr:hypothetical protein [Polyangia bacterium]
MTTKGQRDATAVNGDEQQVGSVGAHRLVRRGLGRRENGPMKLVANRTAHLSRVGGSAGIDLDGDDQRPLTAGARRSRHEQNTAAQQPNHILPHAPMSPEAGVSFNHLGRKHVRGRTRHVGPIQCAP